MAHLYPNHFFDEKQWNAVRRMQAAIQEALKAGMSRQTLYSNAINATAEGGPTRPDQHTELDEAVRTLLWDYDEHGNKKFTSIDSNKLQITDQELVVVTDPDHARGQRGEGRYPIYRDADGREYIFSYYSNHPYVPISIELVEGVTRRERRS